MQKTEAFSLLTSRWFHFMGPWCSSLTRTRVEENLGDPSVQGRALRAFEERATARGVKLAAISPMLDLTAEVKRFGAEVVFKQDMPWINGPLLNGDVFRIPEIEVPNVEEENDVQLEVIKYRKGNTNVPMTAANIVGPVTLAAQLFGVENMLYHINDDDNVTLLTTLFDKTQEYLRLYLEALLKTDVDIVFIHEMSAPMLFLTGRKNTLMERHVKPLIGMIRGAGRVAGLHSSAYLAPFHIRELLKADPDILHVGQYFCDYSSLEIIGKMMPRAILLGGGVRTNGFQPKICDTKTVKEMTLEVLRAMANYNYFFSAGDLAAGSDIDLVLESLKITQQFRGQPARRAIKNF